MILIINPVLSTRCPYSVALRGFAYIYIYIHIHMYIIESCVHRNPLSHAVDSLVRLHRMLVTQAACNILRILISTLKCRSAICCKLSCIPRWNKHPQRWNTNPQHYASCLGFLIMISLFIINITYNIIDDTLDNTLWIIYTL